MPADGNAGEWWVYWGPLSYAWEVREAGADHSCCHQGLDDPKQVLLKLGGVTADNNYHGRTPSTRAYAVLSYEYL